MDVPAREMDGSVENEPDDPASIVTSHETRPGKVVFTERDNTNGWIATDVTVELDP